MPRAPRRCPGDKHTCPNLVTHTTHCPDHTRIWPKTQSPSSKHAHSWAWQKLAKSIKERDKHQCQINGPYCIGYATTVDHILPVSQRPDLADDPTNLRASCRPCNDHKGHTTDRRKG